MAEKKIKVLHIIKSLGRGGAEMLLPETLKIHDTQAFEFHYIYFLPWKDQMVGALRENGGIVSCISAKNNIAIIAQFRKIVNYIKKHEIDIVHCHLPWAGFLGRVVHKFNGIPVLYTEHNKQERYHKVTFFLNRFSFNWQSLGIAVSNDVADSIRKNIKPRIPLTTILNGVNTTSFDRNKFTGSDVKRIAGIPGNSVVIGTVAVFRFQKRLDTWLEEFAAVSAEYPDMYGIIVGDGPLKEQILARRKALGLESRVYMAGLQTEVRPWLAAMNIYMMSSLYEGLPIALLEAMSMACAVVSTDAGGIKEVIEDESHGLLVPTQQPGLLREKLRQLMQNKELIPGFGSSARQRVDRHFSLPVMVKELENLYRQYNRKATRLT